MKSDNLYPLLNKRFPAKEYALMQEVRDAAGYSANRSADFIAVNLWPSRGLAINGIEVKSYRNDWLRELKNPEKAENILQYCDHFWLLTTDNTIAKLEEIPPSWGWMCIKGNRLHTIKDAPKLQPKPLTRNFMAAMLKRACDKSGFIHQSDLDDTVNTRVEQDLKTRAADYNRLKESHDIMVDNLKTFETESGIQIHRWSRYGDAGDLGKAVKKIYSGDLDRHCQQLKALQTQAERIAKNISEILEIKTPELLKS